MNQKIMRSLFKNRKSKRLRMLTSALQNSRKVPARYFSGDGKAEEKQQENLDPIMEELKKNLQNSTHNMGKIKDGVAKVEDALRDFEAFFPSVVKQVGDSKKESSEIEKELTSFIAMTKQEFSKLKKDLLSELESRVETNKADIEKLEQKMPTISAQLERHHIENKDNELRIKELEFNLNGFNSILVLEENKEFPPQDKLERTTFYLKHEKQTIKAAWYENGQIKTKMALNKHKEDCNEILNLFENHVSIKKSNSNMVLFNKVMSLNKKIFDYEDNSFQGSIRHQEEQEAKLRSRLPGLAFFLGVLSVFAILVSYLTRQSVEKSLEGSLKNMLQQKEDLEKQLKEQMDEIKKLTQLPLSLDKEKLDLILKLDAEIQRLQVKYSSSLSRFFSSGYFHKAKIEALLNMRKDILTDSPFELGTDSRKKITSSETDRLLEIAYVDYASRLEKEDIDFVNMLLGEFLPQKKNSSELSQVNSPTATLG